MRERQHDHDLLYGMRPSHPPPGDGSRESSEESVVQLRFIRITARENPHTTCDLPLERRPKLMDRANVQNYHCAGTREQLRERSAFGSPLPSWRGHRRQTDTENSLSALNFDRWLHLSKMLPLCPQFLKKRWRDVEQTFPFSRVLWKREENIPQVTSNL